jgi:hypothetical protein
MDGRRSHRKTDHLGHRDDQATSGSLNPSCLKAYYSAYRPSFPHTPFFTQDRYTTTHKDKSSCSTTLTPFLPCVTPKSTTQSESSPSHFKPSVRSLNSSSRMFTFQAVRQTFEYQVQRYIGFAMLGAWESLAAMSIGADAQPS